MYKESSIHYASGLQSSALDLCVWANLQTRWLKNKKTEEFFENMKGKLEEGSSVR